MGGFVVTPLGDETCQFEYFQMMDFDKRNFMNTMAKYEKFLIWRYSGWLSRLRKACEKRAKELV